MNHPRPQALARSDYPSARALERELIKIRTSEGRVRAKARGVHMGRRSALNQDQQREALARIEAGDALTDIARTFGVSHTTIARLKAKAGL